MTEETYRVKVEDVFEGPMDLLVHLIRKNEVDIYDIPIALITNQYLLYIEWMKSMNIDVAGEFLVLAATLTHIKSRMLLPAREDEEDEDDPRSQIVKPLLEYLRMKSVAEDLAARSRLGEDVFIRPPESEKFTIDPSEQMVKVGLFELIDAFQAILGRSDPDPQVEFEADTISVQDRITQIADILEEKESVTFDELFGKSAIKGEIIVTFLAVLEMVKIGVIEVAQHVQTGIIRIFYL